MIGWGLIFTEIDGKFYGVGTGCWDCLEIKEGKQETEKAKKRYNHDLDNIVKYYDKGELNPLSLQDVEKFPSDFTLILKDGAYSYTDRKKRIHRIPGNFTPWTIMYNDQGKPTMTLNELAEWVDINDRLDSLRKKKKKKLSRLPSRV